VDWLELALDLLDGLLDLLPWSGERRRRRNRKRGR
jgi:hypothetical protein